LPRFKITIDHDRVPLHGVATGITRCLAIDHCWSGIDSFALHAIGKHDFAAVRNAVRIHRNMSGTQAYAVRRGALLLRIRGRPVNRDAGKDRLLPRENGGRKQQCNANGSNKSLHICLLRFPLFVRLAGETRFA